MTSEFFLLIRKSLGFWIQVCVQIEAFEEAFANVFGQVRFFKWRMHEINRPLGGVQNDGAVITACKVFLKFQAKFGAEIAVDVGR